MENMQVIKMTPDTKLNARNHDASGEGDGLDQANKSDLLDDEEDFFDFISRFQSKRMDDQRCSLADSEPTPDPSNRDALNRPQNGGGHAEVQGKTHKWGSKPGERRASRPDSWRPIEPLERAARSLGGSSRPDKEQTA